MKKKVLLLVLILILSLVGQSQYKYERKVIESLGLQKAPGTKLGMIEGFTVFLADIRPDDAKPNDEENKNVPKFVNYEDAKEYIEKKIIEQIHMKRFLAFPGIPYEQERISMEILKISKEKELTDDEISDIVLKVAAKPFMKRFEAISIDLASDRIIEAKKFIAEQYKTSNASMISRKDLKNVINTSAFMYMPYVSEFWHGEVEDKYGCYIRGGIIWFQVKQVEGLFKVEEVLHEHTFAGKSSAIKTTDMMGHTVDNITTWWGDEDTDGVLQLDAKEFSKRSAILQFCKNLKVLTASELDEFKLQGPIIGLDKNDDSQFDMNNAQGIKIDQKFVIGEFIEDEKGDLEIERTGYGFISHIGIDSITSDKRSSVYLQSGNYEEGLMLIEYPTQPIDVWGSFKTKPGIIKNNDDENDGMLFFGGAGGFRGNLGNRLYKMTGMEINQLWFQTEFFFGVGSGSEKSKYFTGDLTASPDSSSTYSQFSIEAGFLKKFFFGRIGIPLYVGAGYGAIQETVIREKWYETGHYSATTELDPETHKAKGYIYIDFASGLEISITPSFTFTGDVGYVLGVQKGNTIDFNDGEEPKETDPSGLRFGATLIYSPTTLPFDPFFGFF
ncbi:MAG: hypothetical protein JXR69_03290 [Candidatus Delongbacteria bacterium]|nr:hypothetical protein [Candidatus Delongbacteria bacterium]